MKKTKKIISIIIILVIAFIIIIISYLFWTHEKNKNLKLELDGEQTITLEVNSDYTPGKAHAKYFKTDVSDKISIETTVNPNQLGQYEEIYTIDYKGVKKTQTRQVHIIDSTQPVITLNGEQEVTIYQNSTYQDPGATALDNYDGDITANIITENNLDTSKVGTYEIIYTVNDSSNNQQSITRTIHCIAKPVINDQKIAVLNYHFFYDKTSEACNESICIDINDFKKQLDYLKQNNYKTLTIKEFRDWMYGEIDIPQKSVLITIDDGAMGTGLQNGNKLIPILEEYQMHATLFLISGWWNKSNYISPYLDVESHTHNMHTEGLCSNQSRGAKMLCSNNDEIYSDLTTSIQTLGTKTAFCFPFYAYNNNAIEQVKKAGFELAFIGGNQKVSRKTDKYKIPRYPIYKTTSLNSFIKMVS